MVWAVSLSTRGLRVRVRLPKKKYNYIPSFTSFKEPIKHPPRLIVLYHYYFINRHTT